MIRLNYSEPLRRIGSMLKLLPELGRDAQVDLLGDLNYLNLKEIQRFCDEHSIPYMIWVETESGEKKRTRESDRKSMVLDRIRHYLKTGRVPKETCFSTSVVRLDGPPEVLEAGDRLYYGWYDKTNRAMIGLLRSLTHGEFRDGAIARILAREFWTRGKAPTFKEFAREWSKANRKGLGLHLGLHPEAAWLTDRARKTTGKDWKAKRARKAEKVLSLLATVGGRRGGIR
jgi:hypothetical protein